MGHGHGVLTRDDGSVYDGPFANDRATAMPPRENQGEGPRLKIKLELDDLLDSEELASTERARALRDVENALLLYNSELKQVYKHYASTESGASAGGKDSFTLSMREFWRFA